MKYQDVKKDISESATAVTVFIGDLSSEERASFREAAHASNKLKESEIRSPHNGQSEAGKETLTLWF
ncbi:hypothetical protein [aff. Roholtiella sp. LEGE 12411]|uniref:hypothetical protein n=1 Tax=aff. Roholtiella sp. LEGE 12411 TaxID=1828822 RepID=UPI001881A188|nr:hypothetical protein [aff. Roholtiella sp. LEGE 12411]MBE9039053.1 hypothetical protein [aff. Roholtiella sp. LEGE 12411]